MLHWLRTLALASLLAFGPTGLANAPQALAAKASKPAELTQAQKEALRRGTPSKAARDAVNPPGPATRTCPALGDEYKRLEADHIIAFNQIASMPGFAGLSCESQKKVVNYLPNFIGLGKSANASKGAKNYKDWIEHKARNKPVDPAFRKLMMEREKELRPALRDYIKQLAKSEHGSKSAGTR